MYKLFSVESGILESPNHTRILYSIITTAATEDDALQYARQHYPEALAEGTEQRVVAIKHLIIDWCAGEALLEETRPKEFRC